jgi:hypothetical protein
MNLTEWAREAHRNAVEHGWWETEPELPVILMLCVTELSEAMEAYRDGKPLLYGKAGSERSADREAIKEYSPTPTAFELADMRFRARDGVIKPEGIAVGMVDCMLRLLDWFGHAGVDVERLARLKHDYNGERPYRHGTKVC